MINEWIDRMKVFSIVKSACHWKHNAHGCIRISSIEQKSSQVYTTSGDLSSRLKKHYSLHLVSQKCIRRKDPFWSIHLLITSQRRYREKENGDPQDYVGRRASSGGAVGDLCFLRESCVLPDFSFNWQRNLTTAYGVLLYQEYQSHLLSRSKLISRILSRWKQER